MSNPAEPDLSVIIACFNDGPMLLEAVASTEHNRRGRHEVIVVNDGSTDTATLEVLDEIERRGHRVLHQKNRGPAAARNIGISTARGRYILPLDADNRIRPTYIDLGIDILDSDPEIDVVYGDPEEFDDRTGRRRVAEFNMRQMMLGNYIDTCAVFRKSIWERVGGYDDRIPTRGVEDWDFWIMVGLCGGGFRHVDEVLFEYRVRPGSLTWHNQRVVNDTATKYLRSKKVRLELTRGEYLDLLYSWDTAVESFRQRPFRTLFRLVARTYFPDLRNKLLNARKSRALRKYSVE